MLRRAGLVDLARRRTDGLSGGQTQRVRFALALVPDPDLLVLDEPTVGMDVESRAFWAAMRELAGAGRTVLFATHYLEEADEFADRVVLMASGTIVADGPATAIKAVVGGRTIRCTLPGADLAALRALPGVTAVEAHGDGVTVRSADADAALRALLAAEPAARDLEVTGADLQDAFLALTSQTHARGGNPMKLLYLRTEIQRTFRVRDGATISDIAARLFLSEGTVRNYLSAAITKTGTRNRVEALRIAETNGWL